MTNKIKAFIAKLKKQAKFDSNMYRPATIYKYNVAPATIERILIDFSNYK